MSLRQRRAFLMTAISMAGVGVVALITGQLGSRTQSGGTAGEAPQAGEAAPGAPEAGGAEGSAAGAGTAGAVTADDGPIVMISRSEWGARPPAVTAQGSGEHGYYNAVSNPNGWLQYDQPPAQVLHTLVIHHSALPLSDGPVEIQNLHMDEKNFADVGYQYLINERGQLFEGRAVNVRGAHAFGCNHGTVGICLIGNFEEIEPTATQLRTLDALINALISAYPRITRMAAHKDCNPGVTLCPGQNLYALLPGIAERFGLLYGI